MQNPLVIWIDTFRDTNAPAMQYKDIYGGVFLTSVMSQINQTYDKLDSGEPQSVYSKVNTNISDVNARIQNWDNLIKNIKAYYQEVLQQILIMRLPNVQTICREPEKDTSFEELKKALLLVLGCAVQCERKEHFIEKIKTLDIKVQHAIVEHIKEVTDDTQCVLPVNPSEQLDGYVEKTLNHLNKLIVERDELAEAVLELKQEQEFYQSQIEGKSSLTAVSPEKHHLVVELADCKAKVRKLRQELEEKIELLSDVMDELDDTKTQLAKIKTEYEEVYQEAKTARAYRDESDMLREKASQVVCYENEITKYKEKLNEMEFFRSRVDELREDNRILAETRTLLEGQLNNAHKRIDSVRELERDLIKCKKQVQDLTEQLDTEKEKVRVLTEENALLEFEKKNRLQESTTLEQELEEAHARTSGISLSDQLSETSNTKVLRLELENQRLQQKLDELRDTSLIESSALNTELEKENKRLAKKVESLQEEMKSQSDKCIDLEQKSKMFEEDKDKMLQMVETVKENTERQLNEVKREKEHLAETITALRDRNEKTNDTRLKELESENKKLHDKISEFTSRCSKLDFENQQMKKSCDRLKASADRLTEVENANMSLERRNADLKNAVSTLKLACDKYENTEQNNSRLEIENKKLSKTIESLQVSLSKQEMLIEEHISLTVENQKLQKTLESLKGATDKVLELEHEKDELNREIQHLKKTIESQRIERVKYEQMEMDILDMDNENLKLQKTLEMTSRRLHQLEQDNNDLEVENEKLQVSIETLKISCKKFENKEAENKELENEVNKLTKDKSTLEKENKKLKHVLEATEAHLDDLTSKHSALDMEHKNLKKLHEKSKDSIEKMHEFEKENKDLQQQLLINKKTLATLREDLVNEKIQMQQLLNEREKLGQELERIGLKSEELMKTHESDDSRYQALENMMQEALKKNMEIKEDKIHSLESRLEESKNRNHKLQEELRCVKKECESLKQRYEEELHEGSSSTSVRISNPAQEILNIKDKVIEVERDNATLIAENKNLQGQLQIANDQLEKSTEENQKRHLQLNTLHEQNNSLHSQQAKFQVENKTLQTQCSSLLTQNSNLQAQLNNIEIENERQLQKIDELQSRFDGLVSDHETLQKLHDDLTTEYESLLLEHGSQKSIHKLTRNEMKDLQDQLSILLRDKNDVNKLQEMLEKEREQLKVESKSLSNLQMEYNQLRNKFDSLQSAHSRLEKEHHDLLTDYKRVKSEYNELQLRFTELQGEATENREQLNSADLEMTKLATRCEAIDQMNQKMEEENNQLLYQMKTLINQNQELLTEALNSKDQHAETTKAYQEKYAELRRQKERLEEKIMEHYKMRLESPKKRSLGATLVRKARGIITRVHRTKSKTNLTNSESPDNSSVGSGSYGDGTDAESNSGRRISARSSEDLLNCEPICKDNACHLGGRVHDYDDGFRGSSSNIAGRISPGSELLTLEQFLRESSSPSPPTLRKKSTDKKINEMTFASQNEQMKRNKTPDGCTGPRPVNMVAGQDHLHPGYNQNNRTHSNSPQHPVRAEAPSNPNMNNYQELNLSKVSRISSGSGDSTTDGKTDGSESHYSSVPPSAYRENMLKTSTPKTRLPYHQENTYSRDHHCQGDNLYPERSSSRNSTSHEQSYTLLRSAKSNSRPAAPSDVSGRLSTVSSDQSSYVSASHEKSFASDSWHNPHDKSQMHHSQSGSIERPSSMHFNNQYPQGSASRPMGSASPFPQKSRDACSPSLYRTDPNLSKSELSLSKTNSRSPDNSVAGNQNFSDYHLTHVDKPISASSILEIRDTDDNYPYRPHPKGPPPVPPPKPLSRDPNSYIPNTSLAASNSNSTSPQDAHRMLPTSSSTSSMLQSQSGHSRNSQSLPPNHTNTGMKNAPTARISPQTKTSMKPQTAAKPVSSSSNNSSASNNKTNDEPKDSKTNSVWTFR